jgi:hypothetical protein
MLDLDPRRPLLLALALAAAATVACRTAADLETRPGAARPAEKEVAGKQVPGPVGPAQDQGWIPTRARTLPRRRLAAEIHD